VTDLDLAPIKARADAAAGYANQTRWRKSAEDVPALLARIAELEADLSDAHHEGFGVGMESADRDIDQIAAAAERRGYERALARLRDEDELRRWQATRSTPTSGRSCRRSSAN